MTSKLSPTQIFAIIIAYISKIYANENHKVIFGSVFVGCDQTAYMVSVWFMLLLYETRHLLNWYN